MNRRQVLVGAGLAINTTLPASAPGSSASVRFRQGQEFDWAAIRRQFTLTPDLIQLTGFYLSSHPTPVREAIERHRTALDLDPFGYHHDQNAALIGNVLRSAAAQ